MIKNFIATILGLLLGLFLFAVGLVAVAILVTYPKLPDLVEVQNYQPREPLTIYSADGVIIGTYGDEKRAFTPIDQFPDILKNAVIAAEDKRFHEHWGVDVIGVGRAIISNAKGGHQQGASTITQQVARNFYLTNERTLTRKFNEALLAYKIEKTLTKNQILELYFNQIYLGQRAYGFAAAARIYFNKPVQDLSLAEATILAGLPKAPSAYNPIVNPSRARLRQEYILNNMVELGMITAAQRQEALNEQLIYERYRLAIDQNSLYVAEMARQELFERYGEEAYTRGFNVYTTVKIADQKAATLALRKALLRNDRSSVYHGVEQQLDLAELAMEEREDAAEQFLANTYTVDGMVPAIVLEANNKKGITVAMQGGTKAVLGINDMGVAKNAIGNKRLGDKAIQVGSVIRVRKVQNGRWTVTQQPALQGALVSLDVNTGAVRAMVGGYDFHAKAFNRATQSIRQPGSTFKPFVYSAALSKGMTASTMVNDAPITIGNWSPQNAGGSYSGMITLRQALTYSKNTVSVRITQAMGLNYTRDYIKKFGFRSEQIPESYALSLGAGSATPLQMAEGYAAFANGGYKVSAYVIDKIYDTKGNLRAEMQPLVAGKNAPRIIDSGNAYVMTSMLRDVVQRGTATAATALGRNDLAGKTGTTNDFKDAWFVGYNPQIVTAVYVGYDTPRKIGDRAFGGTLALPIWVEYMRHALKGTPVKGFATPRDVVKRDNGEVYIKGQQYTGDNIPINNATDKPEAVRKTPVKKEEVDPMEAEEIPLKPINSQPTPQPQRPAVRDTNTDATNELF
ncbi:penicillin-binding protein 1A [Wielerella bovis]|uniref:penicillin-binding protein 1A n=1 Tax=Wielerella bovis TaxID=2917790 RepID=UPI00201961FD|nr:penicillin-binding protein 1A [Wielerella bovis]ULJ65538.1 penicillin-binding protein 1A [Wielerella bovis]